MDGQQPSFSQLGHTVGPSQAMSAPGFPQASVQQQPQGLQAMPYPGTSSGLHYATTATSSVPSTPVFTPAPSDPNLALRITKLAEYTARNGSDFENQVRFKQAGNAEYAFLSGGEGTSYYQWCLYAMSRGLPHDRPVGGLQSPLQSTGIHVSAATGSNAAAPWAAPQAVFLPPEVSAGLAQVLQNLQGSQSSIKAASAWFLACSAHAEGMAGMLTQHVQQLNQFQQQLFAIYLVNDLFFTAAPGTQPVNFQMSAVFQNKLPAIFAAAASNAGQASEAMSQLNTLLDLWRNRGVFDPHVISGVKASMHAVATSAVFKPQQAIHQPASAPTPAGPLAAQPAGTPWQSQPTGPAGHGTFSQHQGIPAHPGVHPWAGAPFWGAAHHGDGHVAETRPAREPEPYDITSFPAGLIPKLVKEQLRYEKEYTPMRPEDIEREPPPKPPVRDAYLQSRLDRFYAELAQYQPGQSRAQYEERLALIGDGLLPPAPDASMQQAHHARMAQSSDAKMRDDGTFVGHELGYGGLGAHAAVNANGDPYAKYRQSKSGKYHEFMAAKSTNPNRPPMGH